MPVNPSRRAMSWVKITEPDALHPAAHQKPASHPHLSIVAEVLTPLLRPISPRPRGPSAIGSKMTPCILTWKKRWPSTRRFSRKAPRRSSVTTVPKQLANVVLLSEIPTTYDKKEQRQVSSGNLLLRGVPGVGKTFFGVILAAISNAKFARLQGRADLQPTEVVGFQMINPATGELVTEFGPLAEAEIILLDEINRIPLKSQSAFLEGLAGSHRDASARRPTSCPPSASRLRR